jgi:hypothetical protein
MTWPSGSAGGDGEQSGCSQYTGTAGRIENAQVAVYLTTPTATRSWPSARCGCCASPAAAALRNRPPAPGKHLLKPVRRLIESVFDTLKRPIDLELHGGRSIDGVGARVGQRLLALTGAIWHNRATGQPATRSLIAYDHWSNSDLLV